MKQVFIGVLAIALALVALNGRFTFTPVAAATAVPSCFFAGYDAGGGQINTGIVCVTPAASGAPQGTPAAGTCIGVSTPPAAGTIAYTCSTPYPTPTASATATACGGAVSASGLDISVPVCATSGPQSTPTGGNCISVSTPPAAGTIVYTCATPTTAPSVIPGGACPACYFKSTTSAFDTSVLAIASVTHFWKGADTAPCNTLADAIAGGATANPSPVPMPTESPVTCGAPGISNDGETSVGFTGSNGVKSCLDVPASTLPTSGSFSILMVAAPQPLGTTSDTPVYFQIKDNTGNLTLYWSVAGVNDSPINHVVMNTTDVGSTVVNAVRPNLYAYTWDGTHSSLYVNGDAVMVNTDTPTFGDGSTVGHIGCQRTSSSFGAWVVGRMSKFIIANTALSQTTIQSLTAALGF